MDLIIIRHGDPDYEHDTLTERGWKEAEILSLQAQSPSGKVRGWFSQKQCCQSPYDCLPGCCRQNA